MTAEDKVVDLITALDESVKAAKAARQAVREERQATTPSLRDRIARALFLDEFPGAAGAWDGPGEGGRARWRRRADAVLAVLADADPTDLGYELVGWQLPEGGFHDAGWVPHYEHDLCEPVYSRPRTEETPDAC